MVIETALIDCVRRPSNVILPCQMNTGHYVVILWLQTEYFVSWAAFTRRKRNALMFSFFGSQARKLARFLVFWETHMGIKRCQSGPSDAESKLLKQCGLRFVKWKCIMVFWCGLKRDQILHWKRGATSTARSCLRSFDCKWPLWIEFLNEDHHHQHRLDVHTLNELKNDIRGKQRSGPKPNLLLQDNARPHSRLQEGGVEEVEVQRPLNSTVLSGRGSCWHRYLSAKV